MHSICQPFGVHFLSFALYTLFVLSKSRFEFDWIYILACQWRWKCAPEMLHSFNNTRVHIQSSTYTHINRKTKQWRINASRLKWYNNRGHANFSISLAFLVHFFEIGNVTMLLLPAKEHVRDKNVTFLFGCRFFFVFHIKIGSFFPIKIFIYLIYSLIIFI